MRNIISNLNKVLFVIGLIASFFAFLPLPQHLYIARIHLNGAVIQTSKGVSDIRFSLWGYCYYNSKKESTYDVTIIEQGKKVTVDWKFVWKGLLSQFLVNICVALSFIPYVREYCNVSDRHGIAERPKVYHRYYQIVPMVFVAQIVAVGIDSALFIKLSELGLGKTDIGGGFGLTLGSFVVLLLERWASHEAAKKELADRETSKGDQDMVLTDV